MRVRFAPFPNSSPKTRCHFLPFGFIRLIVRVVDPLAISIDHVSEVGILVVVPVTREALALQDRVVHLVEFRVLLQIVIGNPPLPISVFNAVGGSGK